MKFVVMVVIKILEDKIPEFREALLKHSENTWGEAGALKFVIYVDEFDPSIFYLFELYNNRIEYEKHIETDYIEIFKNSITPMLREPAQVFRGNPLMLHPRSNKGQI